MPLPIALATVTMSGTTPCCSKPQKYVAEPAVADLHLVGDREPAGRADRRVHLREVAVGQRRRRRRCRRRPRAMNAAGARPSAASAASIARTSSRVAGAGIRRRGARPRNVFGPRPGAPTSGRVSSARGLSASDVEIASVAIGPAVVRLADGEHVLAGPWPCRASRSARSFASEPDVDQEDGVQRRRAARGAQPLANATIGS